jgi:hypothetical protein
MFQLKGDLIDGKSAYLWLVDNFNDVSGDISICSAFLRSSIIKDLSSKFHKKSAVRVMVRWQLGDLLAGASDLESYKYCVELGWKFFVCLNFHGKVFHLPGHGVIVGSANATESGFGLLSRSNSEACTIVVESDSNIQFINHLFGKSIEMNDVLFAEIEEVFNKSTGNSVLVEWPNKIIQELTPTNNLKNKLFLSECLKTNGEELLSSNSELSADARSDLSLLGLQEHQANVDSIVRQFKKTKIFALLHLLLEEQGGEVYFGALTSAVHGWLIEDPTPHRREVKDLVKNLYGWIAGFNSGVVGLVVDRPNHSERIRLI